jgi:DNA-binding NarL/FixJ family response regulator
MVGAERNADHQPMTDNGGPAKCLIIDDHPAILKALASFLREEDIEVVGQATSAAAARVLLARRDAHVALVDYRLPDLDGIELIRRAVADGAQSAFILYTGYLDPAHARAAIEAGAQGILSKEAPLADLVRAVATVANGRVYIDPLFGGDLLKPGGTSVALTSRERDVLRGLAEGLTNEEIGGRLFLSPDTVRTHIRKAATRLGARNRTHAVALALIDHHI